MWVRGEVRGKERTKRGEHGELRILAKPVWFEEDTQRDKRKGNRKRRKDVFQNNPSQSGHVPLLGSLWILVKAVRKKFSAVRVSDFPPQTHCQVIMKASLTNSAAFQIFIKHTYEGKETPDISYHLFRWPHKVPASYPFRCSDHCLS